MLYELTLFGSYFNQQIINRFNYVSSTVPGAVSGSFALGDVFGAIAAGTPKFPPSGTPLFYILNVASSAFTLTSVSVRAASTYDSADFHEFGYASPIAGSQPGSPLSPTQAYGFRTNRIRTDIARGTKRFVGVTEERVAAGGVIAGDFMNSLNDLADSLTAPLIYTDGGSSITFTPCVVSKQEYETDSGRKAYRYYPTLTEQLTHTAVGVEWQAYTQVRTQNSRQYGRGA